MKRRHFLTQSLATGSLVCGLGAGTTPVLSQATGRIFAEPPNGESRYRELNKALDREAMQRGWATSVDPSYHHAPQAAIEAFKDLKFGIRIHWGLYCMHRQRRLVGLGGSQPAVLGYVQCAISVLQPDGF